MFANPIVQREFVGLLRTRKALAALLAMAIVFAVLVLIRWPTEGRVALDGSQSQAVFRMFAYGLMTAILVLTPIFPATSIVREKNKGTLVLLLNSPMSPIAIYVGKLVGFLGFVGLLMLMSLPAAAACYAMGGVSLVGDVLVLYGLLALLAIQCATLGLLVSSYAGSADAAMRVTYASVLFLTVIVLGPHFFLQGQAGPYAEWADKLRCLSPIPAVMKLLRQGGVGAQGIVSETNVIGLHVLLSVVTSAIFAGFTIARLNSRLVDRARSQGMITDEQSTLVQWLRRLFFLVDPKRRKMSIAPLVNPVMVKEFRCRRFGRMHWMIRLAALSAVVSLGLTFAATLGSFDWGAETIGGIMVLLQASLIILLTPSLTAGLISGEVESGGWQLLQMTPLSSFSVLIGKLASVVWPVLMILVATLPGYVVMAYIQDGMWPQIRQILICLGLSAVFSISLSFAVSSMFSRTAIATTVAYSALILVCAGTMLIWLLQDAPFGHSTVEVALRLNPIAAALSVIRAPGFTEYELIPDNWWVMGATSMAFVIVVLVRIAKLSRPQ